VVYGEFIQRNQSTDDINVEPFKLSTETEEQPSYFELVFLMDGRKYRYGFEANREKVVSEWLFYVPKTRETKLFERQANSFKITKSYDADGIQKKTRSNALFLSVSAQFNVEIAEKILEWLTVELNIISGLNDQAYLDYTVDFLLNNENRTEILQLIQKLDLGIGDIQVKQRKLTIDDLPIGVSVPLNQIIVQGELKTTSIITNHRKFDQQGNDESLEQFDLNHHESEGTRKVVALAGLLVAVLKQGEILIIDEFDARLHPLLSRAIVELFNSSETNSNNAQLVFMTHDTNLLSNKLFRRDQIWFTEKTRYGATDLYSLAEYKIPDEASKVRNDASFESDYIKGRYGAIPYIGNLNNLLASHG